MIIGKFILLYQILYITFYSCNKRKGKLGANNMKKLSILLVIGLLIGSGFGGSVLLADKTHNQQYEKTIEIPSLFVNMNDDYFELNLDTQEVSYLMSPGKPMLPRISEYFELPFGAQNIEVEVILNGVQERIISNEILPSPIPEPLSFEIDYIPLPLKDEVIYSSNNLYPSTSYSYRVGCGLNVNGVRVTFITVNIFPVRYIPADGKLHVAKSADIEISYNEPETNPFLEKSEYDLVIISPSKFSNDLERLVNHKNNLGVVNTTFKSTEDIYDEYTGVDKPEQIKYFIRDAIENWNVKYILLVGGLKSMIFGAPRDDKNQGSKDWYVPVRYTNLNAGDDPGFISDLYYADIYKEGGVFDNWDSNDNGVFAEWDNFNKDILDLYPDVNVGRLACRNNFEVNTMIDKIITYEQTPVDQSWFNRIIVVAGDAFQDQEDLDILWDVSGLPDGEYTIYAQSKNKDEIFGPIDVINITLDRSIESSILFTEDDHLKTDTYPFLPIAEITSPSENDILGNTDIDFVPPEAYDGYYWARVLYVDGVMHIRGKSYDPQPYGVITDLRVWIENSEGQTIFTEWRNDTELYYEDEWTTGERILEGRGGTLSYISDEFEKVKLWTSNGMWTGQYDVIDAINQGSGFIHFEGHASPRSWGDQYPGIPGGRGEAQVDGLISFNPIKGPPFFPMSKISNTDKLPVVLAGGCHNGQFNVTVLATLLRKPFMWTYGIPTPECWSWWLTRLPSGGAIATISNTGMGYGQPGKYCIAAGLSGWINSEFFRIYSEENQKILGKTYSQTIASYATNFDMENEIGHVKTIQQWTLLGDPSLKIGGYT